VPPTYAMFMVGGQLHLQLNMYFFSSIFDFEEADVCIMMFIFGVLVTHTEYSNFYLSTL